MTRYLKYKDWKAFQDNNLKLNNSQFWSDLMTRYNSSLEDQHFKAIEDQYYKELDEWHCYEVALEQFARGEIAEKPVQPFLVMV